MNRGSEHAGNYKSIPVPEKFGQLTICPAAERNHQLQHDTAHVLLQQSLMAYKPGRKNPDLHLCYHDYGKPYLADCPDIKCNLSHCDGLAVCLLSRYECGVDAETIRHVRPAVLRRVFTPEEQAQLAESDNPDEYFTKLWTLKEAYVKAIGRGLSFPLREVAFHLQGGTISCNQENAAFFQVLTGTHVISLCILQPDL